MRNQAPKLRELEVLQTLLRTRSVTEAGRLLGVSQPAVSKTLRQLEARLGLQLFRRAGSRFLPTPEAEALIPRLDGVFGAIDALVTAGRAAREGSGAVSIAAIPTLGTVVVPQAVRLVLAQRPGLRVVVQITGTRQVADAVAQGVADIGMVHNTIDDADLVMEDLGLAHIACLVPAGHALQSAAGVTVRDMSRHAYASFPVASPVGDHISEAFAKAGATFAPSMEISSSTVLCEISHRCGIPCIVESYVLDSGWWPGFRALPFDPVIALRPRLIASRRPLSIPAAAMSVALRHVVAASLGAPMHERSP